MMPGIGAPGTRITKAQSEGSELWIYIKQATIGAVAFNVILALVLLTLLCIGWPSLVIVLAVAVGLCYLLTKLALPAHPFYRRRVFRALSISMAISFFIFAPSWWSTLLARDEILEIVWRVILPFILPMWVYGTLLVFWLIAALKHRGKLIAAFIALALLLYGVYQMTGINWTPLLIRLRYIMPMFLISPILFSAVLGIVMLKEMLIPNLDYTLAPLKYPEYVEAGGLLGIIAPKVKQLWADRVERIRLITASEDGKAQHYDDFLGGNAAKGFYRAVDNGESFTYRTAKMGLPRFRRVFLDPFLKRGYVIPKGKDEQYDTLGVELTDLGKQAIHALATGQPLPDWEE